MPVVVTAVFVPREGLREQVIDALRPAIAEVHAEEGCILYAIHDAPDGSIVMLEKWESADLLEAHGSGEPVRRLNASLEGLLEKPVVVTVLTPLPAGTDSQGAL